MIETLDEFISPIEYFWVLSDGSVQTLVHTLANSQPLCLSSPPPATAVAICTIIERPSSQPHILLVSQFRPPVGKSVIEMPAGLIDEGEEGEEGAKIAALRELEEETGYGQSGGHQVDIVSSGGIMFNDPGMISSNMTLVVVKIQLDDEAPDPVAKPEDGEFIEKHLVPVKGLWKRLQGRFKAL